MEASDNTNNKQNLFSYSDSIVKDLTPDEIATIFCEENLITRPKGKILYNEGQRINGCFYVNFGILKLVKTGFDGKEQIIRFAKKGELIAYRSILSNELACTKAKVIEDASLYYIPGDSLFTLINNNSSFALTLLQIACKELREANNFITDIAQKTVRERLAEVLVLLQQSFDLDNENVLQISLTREELANLVGTATESVIRLLSEFKQDKLIELKGRKIKILDLKGLSKIGNVY
ncbi:Crp/Fnr family transcriptional regulator [Bacteroidota bacterium]